MVATADRSDGIHDAIANNYAGALEPWKKIYESEIAARGYHRVYLTTGDRQPEAEALYLATGYHRLDEPLAAEGEVYPMAFAKEL